MKATIKWVDEAMFVAETGSGHALVVDGPPDAGGRNLGPRPMELVLAGLGSCTAFDVVAILGSQMTQQELQTAEALMPHKDLPREINIRRLDRLDRFFSAAAKMQTSLANLNPEQRKAIMFEAFTGMMMDNAAPVGAPGGAPQTLDLGLQ